MCGLVGVINKQKLGFTNTQVKVFSQMLFANQLRGADGTGMFYNNDLNSSNIRILKAAISSSYIMSEKGYDSVMEHIYDKSNFIIGHNRSATKGNIDAASSHPFREGHITLVHNGTLISHKELHSTYEVDSRAICYSMNNIGEKETIKKLDGAFALIWFNTKTGTLNFCRNSERPLHLLETANAFILSSEEGLASWILGRNTEKVLRSMKIKTHVLYTFDINDFTTYKEEPLEYYECKYEPYKHQSGLGLWPYDNEKYTSTEVSKNKFTFGQKIKFKTGDICGNYVEGDILKYQYLTAESKFADSDFEHEWRIRIYGSKEYLKTVANKGLAEGQIHKTKINNDSVSSYNVSSVHVLREEIKTLTVLTLPNKEKKTCQLCNIDTNSISLVDGWGLCKTCAEDVYGVALKH